MSHTDTPSRHTGEGQPYADASGLCGEPALADAERGTLANPQLLGEVLSRSSEAYDRAHQRAQTGPSGA